MNSPKQGRVYFIVITIVAINFAVIYGVRARRASQSPPDPLATHQHVLRVADKVDEIRSESFAELIDTIPDDWVTRYSGIVIDESLHGRDFPFTLANRNTRRIVDELRSHSAKQRQQQCLQIFDQLFQQYCNQFDDVLESLERGTATGSDQAIKNHLAICSSVFVTAKYSDFGELSREVQQLIELRAKVTSKLEQLQEIPPSVRTLMPKSVLPDDEFLLSVFWLFASRQNATSPTGVARQKDLLVDAMASRNVRREEVSLPAWDARIDWFDLPMLHDMAQLDRSKGTTPYDILFWGDSNSAQRQKIITDLLDALE